MMRAAQLRTRFRLFLGYAAVLGTILLASAFVVHALLTREYAARHEVRLAAIAHEAQEKVTKKEGPDFIPFENENMAAAVRQLDIGLGIGVVVATVMGSLIVGVLSLRVLARMDETLDRVRRFTGDAAHELRTPLAAIANNAENLTFETPGGVRSVENIRHAAAQMQSLMEGLLILARADEDAERELYAVDVGGCVEEIVRPYQRQAAERAVTLRVHPSGRRQTLYGLPQHVDRILINLLENALRYTPRGGTIEVSHVAESNAALLTVRDSGIGIDPEALDRVFDRFWRADATGTSEGSGLGLAIVKALVRRQGGEVSVKSAPGAGSEFAVRLPLRPRHTKPLSTIS